MFATPTVCRRATFCASIGEIKGEARRLPANRTTQLLQRGV
jgi:hypothetical protein